MLLTTSETFAFSKSRRTLWVVLGLVLLALGVAAARAAGRHRELNLSVSLEKSSAYQGDPVLMTLTVENTSGRALRIDQWTSIVDGECLGATGLPVSLSLYFPPRADPVMQLPAEPGNLGVKTLLPGDSLELHCNITKLFNLVKPGTYRIHANYHRDRWAAKASWPARLWAALLTHEPLTLELRPRAYDDPDKM